MKTPPSKLVRAGIAALIGLMAACQLDKLINPHQTPGATSRFSLVFTTHPSRVTRDSTFRPPVQVTVFDSSGNRAAGFTGLVRVALGDNGSPLRNGRLVGTRAVQAVAGVATFADLRIDQPGSRYTLTAAFETGPSVVESFAFDCNITPGPGPAPATLLRFTQEPRATRAGAVVVPPVQVAALDSTGNIVTSFGGNITLTIGTNPSAGNLTGGGPLAAVNGVATFPVLRIDRAGNGYRLWATSDALTATASNSFDITGPPPATQLAFSVQPRNAAVGATITPAVQVTALDAAGNPATSFTGDIVLTLWNNPGLGALSGGGVRLAVNGVASFPNLSIDRAGNGYTLRATSGTLTPATSSAFNITPPSPQPPATSRLFTQNPPVRFIRNGQLATPLYY